MKGVFLLITTIVAAVGAMTTSACGGSSPQTPTAAMPTTMLTATLTNASPVPPSPTAAPRAVVPTMADLTRALITVRDVPTGWTSDPPKAPDHPTQDYPGLCEFRAKQSPSVAAIVIFTGTGRVSGGVISTPTVQETLASYASADTAIAFMHDLSEALTACPSYAYKSQDETLFSPMSFPNLGDDPLAFQSSSLDELLGQTLSVDVYVRRGSLVIRIGATAFSGSITDDAHDQVSAPLIEQLSRSAVDKAQSMFR